MESVLDMLRPLHFVFLFVAFAFLALSAAAKTEGGPPTLQNEAEPPQQNGKANDLETEATAYWGGYGQPYYGGYGGYGGYGRGYGGWGGGWGRGYYGGYGGRGYWGGRGYGGGYWG